jgi:hypothetical protein
MVSPQTMTAGGSLSTVQLHIARNPSLSGDTVQSAAQEQRTAPAQSKVRPLNDGSRTPLANEPHQPAASMMHKADLQSSIMERLQMQLLDPGSELATVNRSTIINSMESVVQNEIAQRLSEPIGLLHSQPALQSQSGSSVPGESSTQPVPEPLTSNIPLHYKQDMRANQQQAEEEKLRTAQAVQLQVESTIEATMQAKQLAAALQDPTGAKPLTWSKTDIDKLVDKVYKEIERKIKFERQRRGL